MHSLSHRSSRFFCCQISLQRAAFSDLLEGLGHLKRLGSRGSAQAGIGHRKTVLQVCAYPTARPVALMTDAYIYRRAYVTRQDGADERCRFSLMMHQRAFVACSLDSLQVLHSLGRFGASSRAVLAPEPLARLATEVLAGICSPLVADVLGKW